MFHQLLFNEALRVAKLSANQQVKISNLGAGSVAQ